MHSSSHINPVSPMKIFAVPHAFSGFVCFYARLRVCVNIPRVCMLPAFSSAHLHPRRPVDTGHAPQRLCLPQVRRQLHPITPTAQTTLAVVGWLPLPHHMSRRCSSTGGKRNVGITQAAQSNPTLLCASKCSNVRV
jgi:hypothetical protein